MDIHKINQNTCLYGWNHMFAISKSFSKWELAFIKIDPLHVFSLEMYNRAIDSTCNYISNLIEYGSSLKISRKKQKKKNDDIKKEIKKWNVFCDSPLHFYHIQTKMMDYSCRIPESAAVAAAVEKKKKGYSYY